MRNGYEINSFAGTALFCGAFVGYNFINGHLFSRNTNIRFKLIKTLALIALPLGIYAVSKIPETSHPYLIAAGVLSAWYKRPVFNKRSLRDYPFLKIATVAMVWTLLSEGLAISMIDTLLTTANYAIYIQRFLLVFLLCIPFEIRDLNTDNGKIITLPKLIGIKNTLLLSAGLTLVAILCIIGVYDVFTVFGLIDMVILLITMLLIMIAPTKKDYYFAAFYVEAIPILYLLAYYLFT